MHYIKIFKNFYYLDANVKVHRDQGRSQKFFEWGGGSDFFLKTPSKLKKFDPNPPPLDMPLIGTKRFQSNWDPLEIDIFMGKIRVVNQTHKCNFYKSSKTLNFKFFT